MRHIDYNFQGMLDAISGIKECSADPKQKSKMGKYLRDLKEELNKFFKDSTCEEIIYTDNSICCRFSFFYKLVVIVFLS